MQRRTALKALAGVAGLGGGVLKSSGSRRSNILFLMTDEHRADAIGYSNKAVKTPHLDRLASEAVVFTNAYSTSPSCVPARAAIYTGRYPSQCGAPTYITYLPSSETTFMRRLRAAGYYTAAIGKQHFGQASVEHGYDYEDLIDGEAGAQNDSYTRALREAGLQQREMRKPAGKFAFRWEGDPRYHIDGFVGDRAVEFVQKGCPVNQPWFLTVSFHGPHQPFDGLGLPTEGQYTGPLPRPFTTAADLRGKPPHFSDIAGHSGGLDDAQIALIRRSYYSKISFIDQKIGQILAALKARGEYDNTLIVFTADHGDFMGEFGMVYKAQYLSEALMRIPMLAKPPIAGFQGRTVDAFVQNFDIAPTSLATAGATVPAGMPARDLTPFWSSPAPARRELCFFDAQSLQGVRDRRWKLVQYRDRRWGELYDLEQDPYEKLNLWDSPAVAEVKARLRNELLNHVIGILPNAGAEWNHGAPAI